jgi:predicted Rdx family selenoprotein
LNFHVHLFGFQGRSAKRPSSQIGVSVFNRCLYQFITAADSTGLDTFEYLLEVTGAGPVLAGAESARIDPAISYPRYRDGQVPDLAPKTRIPDLAAGVAAFLKVRTRIYNGTLQEVLRRLEVAPLKRQKEANLEELIGDDLLVWDGKLDTDIPSLDELTEAVGDLLTAELKRLDEIPKQSSEEDDDEVIEQPKKGKGGGKAVKPGKGGKGAKGGKQGRGGKGGKDKL